jgi:hypothetical protein
VLSLQLATSGQNGALSSTDWNTFNSKENAITAGTTAQYFRGDKTFQTLNTSVVPELTNLYYTEARVNANTNVAANTAARHNAVTLGTANGLSLSTQVLSLGLASAGVTGALSGTDWTNFNGKVSSQWITTGSNIYYNTGNVGIGTAIPTNSKLLVAGTHVSGNSILGIVPIGNQTATIGLYNSSVVRKGLLYSDTGFVRLETDSDPLQFLSAGNFGISIFTNGRVFVGSSPSDAGFQLDVNGTGRFSGRLNSTTLYVNSTEYTFANFTSAVIGPRPAADGIANLWLRPSDASNNVGFNLAATSSTFSIGSLVAGPFLSMEISGGAATFSSTLQTGGDISLMNASGDIHIRMKDSSGNADRVLLRQATTNDVYVGDIDANNGRLIIRTNGNDAVTIASSGAATFSASVATPHTTKSANYTLTATDFTVGFDCASNRTANLPDATTCAGRVYVIYHYNTGMLGSRYVTIDPNGSQTIKGLTTFSLQYTYDFSSVMIQSNGSNWIIISDSIYYAPV